MAMEDDDDTTANSDISRPFSVQHQYDVRTKDDAGMVSGSLAYASYLKR
jgi:hypothetical protein